MTQAEKFKKAIEKMYECGDFDKQIKHPTNRKIKKFSIADKKYIQEVMEYGIEKIPFIVLIMDLQSADTFKNALCYMPMFEDE